VDSGQAQSFYSSADVLSFLNENSFSKNSTTLKFSQNGAFLKIGNTLFNNPSIKVISNSTAYVKYFSINNPSIAASLIVEKNGSYIIDRSSNTKYEMYSAFDQLERIKQENIQKEKEKDLNWPPNKIIGKPIKIGDLEVAQYDFPERMKWRNVYGELSKLGKDWRIPTMNELKILFQNKDKIKGFSSDGYWSSTTSGSYSIFGVNFNNGSWGDYDMYSILGLRAIRTNKSVYFPIKDERKIINNQALKTKSPILIPSQVIGNPIKIQRLEFAQFDFPNEMNWFDAKIACAKLGDGWRLPYIHELNLLYSFKNKIGGFTNKQDSYHNYYWSSTEAQNSDTCYYAWYINLEKGDKSGYYQYGKQEWNDKHNAFYVRAVRSDTTSPVGITTKINTDMDGDKLPQGIEVAQYDFPDRMNWSDAKAACEKLGYGWRLADEREFSAMASHVYTKKYVNANFNDGKYWYTELQSDGKSEGRLNDLGIQFDDGYRKNEFNLHHVRAVRAFDNENYDSAKVDQIIAMYITEIGGADKWSKVQSINIEGQIESFNFTTLNGKIESQKLITPFLIRGAHMKGVRLDLEIQGNKIIDQITTPVKGWKQDASANYAKLIQVSDDENKKNLDDLDIQDAFINYKEKGSVIKSLGSYNNYDVFSRSGEDVLYFRIKMTSKNGTEKIYHFNTKTNLIYMVESIVKKEGKEIKSETEYLDYQTIDYGIKFPFIKNIDKMKKVTKKFVTKKITINPSIDFRIFEEK